MSSPATQSVTDVSPELLEQWLESGDAALVDVREDFEFAEEHVGGADHRPLGSLDPSEVRTRHGERRVVFMCRTGRRSLDAANRFRSGDEAVFHLAGGIEGWKASGRTVKRPETGPRLPIMRQVQITAGSMVAVGTGLGAAVDLWFLVLPGFVGCGLVFAGASGWCGMAVLLARMPWNTTRSKPAAPASCAPN